MGAIAETTEGNCCICGREATGLVRTMRELDRVAGQDGQLWRRGEIDETYRFCDEHYPPESVIQEDQTLRAYLSRLGLISEGSS